MIKQVVYLDGVTFPLGTEFSSNQKANENDCNFRDGKLRIPYKELKRNASTLTDLTDIIDVPKNCLIAVEEELGSPDEEKGIKRCYNIKPSNFTNQNYNWDDDEITPITNIKPDSEKLDLEINVDGKTDDDIQLYLDYQDLKKILKRSKIDSQLRLAIEDILTNRGFDSISEALNIFNQELHEIQRCKRFISDLILGDDEHIEDSFRMLQEQYEALQKEWYIGDYGDDDNPDEPFTSLDNVLTAFKENKEDFFENFGKYVYSEFFDLFRTILPQDFQSFNSDQLQPISWTQAEVNQGYRPSYRLTGFTVHEDSYWFRLFDLPIDVRDILIEKLRDAFDRVGFREKELEDEIKTLERVSNIRIPVTLYVLGSNDILEIANKANKDLKFINYDSINEITESELSKLKNFKYYIDSNCRITIITNNGFHKFIPNVSIESLNAPAFYESIQKVLENKEKDLSDYIKNESVNFLRERLNDPEKFMYKSSISHYKEDDDYMDTIKKMIKIKSQLYYVTNIIPEDKRELYSKTDWYMCRFLQGESLHGVIEQTLLV